MNKRKFIKISFLTSFYSTIIPINYALSKEIKLPTLDFDGDLKKIP